MSLVIVHSHLLNSDGDPGVEYKARLDGAANLFINGKVDSILLTGGMATQAVGKIHSNSGIEYLAKGGISPDKILMEKLGALDTVGDFVFARKEYEKHVFTPEQQIIHLSSDYHLPRIQKIAPFIWGSQITNVKFHGVVGFHKDKKLEEQSLKAFHHTFSGVEPGDIEGILETLWKRHPLYLDHPENPNSI